ncbi:imm11 family protein [Pyxidicoccus sp. 3LFB2]
MRYFRLFEDLYIPGRWYLDTPLDGQGEESGSWLFMQGEPASVEGAFKVNLFKRGRQLDFSMADAGSVPVIHPKLVPVFTELASGDVQLFPVTVEGQPEPYSIVNVTRVVKCIDDAACTEVQYWKPEDGRPEKTGRYRSVLDLRIDKTRVGGAKVFRTWGWNVALIVSEDFKDAMERTGATGMEFTEV